MLSKVVLCFIVALATLPRRSLEDCRVLADCEGGIARWRDFTGGNLGRPGKRGATGAQGQKGEPGVGVNLTALKQKLKQQEDSGPKLHFYAKTVTWDAGKSFCENQGKNLCSFDQICVPLHGGRELASDVIPGDNWAPVIDSHNEWVQVGNSPHKHPCFLHSIWSKPGWGTSSAAAAYKGYVYCCKADMKYQYIGYSATYDRSERHCDKQGRRLCYSSEICSNSLPKFGVAASDQWAAVKDNRNDWIQIGNNGQACRHHGILPDWGTRTDDSIRTYVGYVLCCAKTQ